jgi:serine-type D-Ala-D-Ala carboxypeptidase/endopeptidase (penicillin-binding protein 4)
MRIKPGKGFFAFRIPLFLLATALVFSFQNTAVLKERLEVLAKDPEFSHGMLSFHLCNAKGDSQIISLNGGKGMVPASALKAITTATALEILKPDFTFKTEVGVQGKINAAQGSLDGNLIIRGGGDPGLVSKHFGGTAFMLEWVDKLKKAGIKEIKGSVIGDASLFGEEITPSTWIWGDMGNYYGASPSGLNFCDNSFTVFYTTGESGSKARISKIKPAVPEMKLESHVTASGFSDQAFIYGGPFEKTRKVFGTIPAGKTDYEVEGSLPDPAFYCAWFLDSLLRAEGIKISGQPKSFYVRSSDSLKISQTLFVHQSPSLQQYVNLTNKKSNNLFAECIFRTLSAQGKAIPSISASGQMVKNHWAGKGIDMNGFYMNDGSGLSRWNSLTAEQFCRILGKMTTSPHFGAFQNSLVSGYGNLYYKSGYISRVRSYVGYRKQGNKIQTFSLIVNNYDCSPKMAREKLEWLLNELGK